jgi:hypothetical protein
VGAFLGEGIHRVGDFEGIPAVPRRTDFIFPGTKAFFNMDDVARFRYFPET